MKGIGAKKMMVSLMVLMMVVLAQGRAQAELADVHPTADTGHCAKRCAFKCMFRIFPKSIALCFCLCMISCKLEPSEGVFNCTSGCANSMVNTYNPTDTERVENFVGSCYETCKQNNNN
ncbi:hypothetical protein REPUB_Repub14bG0042300 [Reevesia pubescens]